MKYFFYNPRTKQSEGPYSIDMLRELVSKEELLPESKLCTSGGKNWFAASEIDELFGPAPLPKDHNDYGTKKSNSKLDQLIEKKKKEEISRKSVQEVDEEKDVRQRKIKSKILTKRGVFLLLVIYIIHTLSHANVIHGGDIEDVYDEKGLVYVIGLFIGGILLILISSVFAALASWFLKKIDFWKISFQTCLIFTYPALGTLLTVIHQDINERSEKKQKVYAGYYKCNTNRSHLSLEYNLWNYKNKFTARFAANVPAVYSTKDFDKEFNKRVLHGTWEYYGNTIYFKYKDQIITFYVQGRDLVNNGNIYSPAEYRKIK